MAPDARHSGAHSPYLRHDWDEKETDKLKLPSEQLDLPPGAATSDTRSNGAGRNSTPVPSGNICRSLDGSVVCDEGSYCYVKPKLRTLPGVCSIAPDRRATKLTIFAVAWIRSVDHVEDEGEPSAADRLLPSHPGDAVVAHHNYSPHATSKPDYSGDSLDTVPDQYSPRQSRWKSFAKAIAYPREQGVEEKYVSPDWLDNNLGDYSTPWRSALLSGEDSEDLLKVHRRRQIWFRRTHSHLLRSPIVPLVLRLTVWCLSVAALAIGGSIQHLSGQYNIAQGPSALMAIIVDAVAMVYLVYIAWDEYSSKPLGLRSPTAKARLILLDIFFIVFDSANLSLAFVSLSSVTGSCTRAEVNHDISRRNNLICDQQKALASILLVALIAWLMTFSISVLRRVSLGLHCCDANLGQACRTGHPMRPISDILWYITARFNSFIYTHVGRVFSSSLALCFIFVKAGSFRLLHAHASLWAKQVVC